MAATTAHKPTDTDFSAAVAKLHEANCDVVVLGTIVRDTMIIVSTVKKIGWNVDLVGQAASYDTAVATAPGGVGEGFYSMTPTLYVYPDDPRPAIQDLMARYRAKYGIDINYIGQTGVTCAEIAIEALRRMPAQSLLLWIPWLPPWRAWTSSPTFTATPIHLGQTNTTVQPRPFWRW